MQTLLTPKEVERAVGLPDGSLEPVAWMILQEMAAGRGKGEVAVAVRSTESELDAYIDSVTGQVGAASAQLWASAQAYIVSRKIMNAQSIELGWDSLEAMTLSVLAQRVSNLGPALPMKDALAIATLANKALRRGRNEGPSQERKNGMTPGSESEIAAAMRSGNVGSIRLNLSIRVQQQLEKNKSEEIRTERQMLTLEATRKLADDDGNSAG